MNYLKSPDQPVERKVKIRALSYVICGEDLFKKSHDGTLLQCLGEKEAHLAMSEIHDGICGAHQAGDK